MSEQSGHSHAEHIPPTQATPARREQSSDPKTRWFKPVNRLGRTTEIIAIIASFFPFIYLCVVYGQIPDGASFGSAIGMLVSAYVVSWIVEPISYFPALGTAGTYMGILAGSMAQMRVPAALVAKRVAGVEDNTQEAEIIGTCGIAGSVYMNIIILTLTLVFGNIIIAALPQAVLDAMSKYVLPAIFGAILAMFTTKGKLQITVPVFALSILFYYLATVGFIPIPIPFLLIISVVLGVIVARIEYKLGWAK